MDNVELDIDKLNEIAESYGSIADKQTVEIDLAEKQKVESEAKEDGQEVNPVEVKSEEENDPATLMDYVKDTGTGVYKGLQQTASSIVTLPEQVLDYFNGEMAREGENYKPEWDDWFVKDDNPIETKTWWGALVKNATHVASLWFVPIPGVAPLAKGAQAAIKTNKLARLARLKTQTLKVTPKFKLLGRPTQVSTKRLLKSAGSGMKFDALSITSLEDNVSGQLKGHIPLLDTALATKDHDHPMMKKFKNVAEGIALGPVFDGVLDVMGQGAKVVFRKYDPKTGKASIEYGTTRDMAAARDDSVRDQIGEMGIDAKKQPGFNAYKNKPIADPHQGNAFSSDSMESASDGLARTRNEFGAEDGVAGSVLSNQEITSVVKSSGLAREVVEKIYRRGVSENYFKQLKETAARQGIPYEEALGRHASLAQEVYEGRATSDFTPQEFWKKITDNVTDVKRDGKVVYSYTNPEMSHAVDIINGTLLGEIRSLGIVGRELENLYSLRDSEGPAQQLVEKFIAGLRIRTIQKAEVSQQLRDFNLKPGKRPTTKEMDALVDAKVQESIDAFRVAMQLAPEEGGDELFKTIFESVTMADGIRNMDDLDTWMRMKMRGGAFKDGEKTPGALTRELGTMMTHSVLSGPKTAVRAIMGTSSATFTRPLAMAIGSSLSGDWRSARQGLAALNAMREAVPESFELFKKRLNAYWAGDISTIKTRFVERTKQDDQWEMYGHWADTNGTKVDKALFRTANLARAANDSKFLTYSTKIMAATDDAFGLIIGRARAREQAFLKAMDELPDGKMVNLDQTFFKSYEDSFNKQIFDKDGNLTDAAAAYSKREATLTQDLSGFAGKLESAFNSTPWARPFFLFARTGINGLQLTAKHTPGFNFLVDEWNQIAFTKPGTDLTHLKNYGITDDASLMAAKAVQSGRLAMGSAAITMASMAYLNGGLHGNGPTDRQKRQSWLDSGWKPRTIKIGDAWVSYDSFEPYNQILTLVGDIGDHMEMMGEEWAEDRYLKLSMALASTITSKSYLAGLQSFVDLFSGAPGQQNRIISSLANNTLPLSSLRNEIGKLLTPYTRELGSDIWSSIRNRNLITENIASEPLPIKYDLLTGKPIKDHNFPTRMFNMFSPVQFNLDYSPGRAMLFNSGYDLRTATYYAPDGTDLSNSPRVRSLYQKAIGDQNLEAVFNKMAGQDSMLISIARMEWQRKNGGQDLEPRSFPHYDRIHRVFERAKKKAWAKIRKDIDVKELMEEEKQNKIRNYKANKQTIDAILNVNK